MKKQLIYSFWLIVFACISVQPVVAEEWIVETTKASEIESSIIDHIAGTNIFLIESDLTVEQILAMDGIETVEKNESIYVQQVETPALTNDAVTRWSRDIPSGLNEVTVAVVDSGINLLDVKLAPYIKNSFTTFPNDTVQDTNGHGTEVAHIIVDNAPKNIRIVPIKILNRFGRGSIFTVVKGLQIAKDQQVDLVNLSFGGGSGSETLQEAVQQLNESGITIVAAVGNSGGLNAFYPARYNEVIGIGSHDEEGNNTPFTQVGEGVDVFSIGTNLKTTNLLNETVYRNGTSFSAAYFVRQLAHLQTLHIAQPTNWQLTIQPFINSSKRIDEAALQAAMLKRQDYTYAKWPKLIKEKNAPLLFKMSQHVDPHSVRLGSIFAVHEEKLVDIQTEVQGKVIEVTAVNGWQNGTKVYITPTTLSEKVKPLHEAIEVEVLVK